MIALVSMMLAGIVTLVLGATDTVTTWWILILIGLGSWLGIYLIIKVLVGMGDGKSFGEAVGEAFGDIGDIGDGFGGDGASCGGGGCGSGGSD